MLPIAEMKKMIQHRIWGLLLMIISSHECLPKRDTFLKKCLARRDGSSLQSQHVGV